MWLFLGALALVLFIYCDFYKCLTQSVQAFFKRKPIMRPPRLSPSHIPPLPRASAVDARMRAMFTQYLCTAHPQLPRRVRPAPAFEAYFRQQLTATYPHAVLNELNICLYPVPYILLHLHAPSFGVTACTVSSTTADDMGLLETAKKIVDTFADTHVVTEPSSVWYWNLRSFWSFIDYKSA